MEVLSKEQLEMGMFHLIGITTAPMSEVLSLSSDPVELYLNLLHGELPPGLQRDLMRLSFFDLSHVAQAAMLENILTQGDGGVVSWALEDAWNLTPEEVEEAKAEHGVKEPDLSCLCEAASQRFHRLMMESREYASHFDGWGRFQGSKFLYHQITDPWLTHMKREAGKGYRRLTAPQIRENLRFHPMLMDNGHITGVSLNDLMRFMSHYDKNVPDPMFKHAEEEDIWSNGYHSVFTEENMKLLPREAKEGLFKEMFQAQELFTKERILEFKEVVHEYNFQWAVASFDWSGGEESSIITRMREYVAASPYEQDATRGSFAQHRIDAGEDNSDG